MNDSAEWRGWSFSMRKREYAGCKEQYWSTLHSSAILAFFHIERMYLQTRSSVSLQSQWLQSWSSVCTFVAHCVGSSKAPLLLLYSLEQLLVYWYTQERTEFCLWCSIHHPCRKYKILPRQHLLLYTHEIREVKLLVFSVTCVLGYKLVRVQAQRMYGKHIRLFLIAVHTSFGLGLTITYYVTNL